MVQPTYTLKKGTSPVIVSLPHSGTDVSPVAKHTTHAAHTNPDCDWHLSRLYGFLERMDVTVLEAHFARTVIDLNRDPSGHSLYPGQNVTELCPLSTFDEQPVYHKGFEPSTDEIIERTQNYWQPYHQTLQSEIARIKALHGHAILWDAHSIKSIVPRFFEGTLPDLNFGTNNGLSCSPHILSEILSVANRSPFNTIANGRFKGGYITRTYGTPQSGIHAVQLELSQATYMQENYPYTYMPEKAAAVMTVLELVFQTLVTIKV